MKEIKTKLKKLSKEFNLHYQDFWFDCLWISKKENILLEYLWMCPDPIYNKFGKSPLERAKNIEEFISSSEFIECINRWGGQVIEKKDFEKHFLNWTNYIENKEVKKIYLDLYKKIIVKLNSKNSKIAILTKSKNKKEVLSLKSFVLLHEWVHVILDENKLRINNNWKYNEGLVTYFQEFAEDNLNKLERFRDRENYSFQKQYYIYAIKFREWLKNIQEPRMKKKKIQELVKKYSKENE